jgi:hypothetical protein
MWYVHTETPTVMAERTTARTQRVCINVTSPGPCGEYYELREHTYAIITTATVIFITVKTENIYPTMSL